MAEEIEFRYDTQLLIDGKDIDEDELDEYIRGHFVGDSLLVIADEDTAKLHFHTNEPWKILEYCATLGEIYDIVVEDMIRQSRGEKG
ncbi:MAG: kinase to dihydroxyacetone kinase [Oscillospiraceae bacterium]|nr:kinase to dihydroxyacetone kinase [Oscillospiraceae bacterium]